VALRGLAHFAAKSLRVARLFKQVWNFLLWRVIPQLRRAGAVAGRAVRQRPKTVALSLATVVLGVLVLYQALSETPAASARAIFERARTGEADPYRAGAAAASVELAGAVTYTKFLSLVKADEVAAAILPRRADTRQLVAFETRSGQYATTTLPNSELAAPIANLLVEHQVELLTNVAPIFGMEDVSTAARQFLPLAVVIAILLFVVGRGPGGTGTPGEWILPEKNSTRFADVKGIDEAKAELVEAVEHLLNPGSAAEIGAKAPRGVILIGQPGTGKTLLARAVAGEAGAAFLRLSGSDFVEMWVGLGARRVRNIFKAARKRAPCVIFIDEIDSLGRKRGGGTSGADRESDQTLNALLVELDGFTRNDRILVLAATNRVDTIDAALLRPGRFDRHVHISLPDKNGRRAILEAHAKDFKLADGTDLELMARGTPGFTGADLANIVNEAAFAASRRGGKAICAADFETARDRVLMGSERKSLAWREDERIQTAWHEAGHALVAVLTPASDPVHKATILPRRGALGMVMRLPEHDRFMVSRAKLEADLAVAVAGRIAEGLIFGAEGISTGAEADISAATDLAHSMVARWGMSKRLGFVRWTNDEHAIAEPVRREMKQEIDRAMTRASGLITKHRLALEGIAEALLDKETLDRAELERIVAQAPVAESTSAAPSPAPPRRERARRTRGVKAAE
jgi:cell division protease FtsH